jgi:hypothetical protein
VTTARKRAIVGGRRVSPLAWSVAAMFGLYGVTPVLLRALDPAIPQSFDQVAFLASIACVGLILGYCLMPPLRVAYRRKEALREVRHTVRMTIVVAYFMVISALLLTAPSVPLLDAIRGESAEVIIGAREHFLKARAGWALYFVYAHAALAGSLVPYAIAQTLQERSRRRFELIAGFFLGCMLFAEKAFFVRAMVPIAATFWRQGQRRMVLMLAAGSLGILVSLAALTSESSDSKSRDVPMPEMNVYFSSSFGASASASPIGFLGWRSIAVPLFTAADSLATFAETYGSCHFFGATSTPIAAVIGRDRIPFERSVYDYQWGQNAVGTGSANAVFFIEAFVNFGTAGVFVIAVGAGACLAWIAASPDDALSSLWPLYLYGLLCSGFLGTLLSNGFIIVLFLSWFARAPLRYQFSPIDIGTLSRKGSYSS